MEMETAASFATQPEIKVEVADDESLLEYFTAAGPDVTSAHQCDVSTQTDDADFGERYRHFTKIKTRAENLYRQVETLSRCLLSATEEMGEALEEARDLSVVGLSFPSRTTSDDLHLDADAPVWEPAGSGNNEIAPQSHVLPAVSNSATSRFPQSPHIVQSLTLPTFIDSHQVHSVAHFFASPQQENERSAEVGESSSIYKIGPTTSDEAVSPTRSASGKDSVAFGYDVAVNTQSRSIHHTSSKRPRLSPEAEKGALPKKKFKCHLCSYSSFHSSHIKHHGRIHTGEKPFKCDQCEFCASQKGDLNRHIRIHTGQKPFQCNQCSYASVQRSALTIHLRTHTGEKPFKCPECDFRTAHGRALSDHIRTHTGERPHLCSHCDFRTSKKSQLVQHFRIHTGERPYKCTQCPYAAAHLSSLKRHKKRIH